jgi:uncharacterized membrane protein
MIGWLLLAVFVIIWGAFLFPSWRRSPTSTVEEFEQRMSLLAEANRASPGRWVLVPKKGHRFLGPQDRQRARVRQRRRFLFVALLDLIGLTFLMGLFQPLRAMLVMTALLCVVLVAYVALLLRLRMVEQDQARRRRAMLAAQRRMAYANGYDEAESDPYARPATRVNGHGNGNGFAYGDGNGNGNGNGHVRANGHGNGNGRSRVVDERYLPDHRYLRDGVVEIIDEDVHVIVRRSGEVDLQALRAGNASTAD